MKDPFDCPEARNIAPFKDEPETILATIDIERTDRLYTVDIANEFPDRDTNTKCNFLHFSRI